MTAEGAFGTYITVAGNRIGSLDRVGIPSLDVDEIETTTHDDYPTRFKRFIAGLVDPGEVTLSGNFDPADTDGQVYLRTIAGTGTIVAFVVHHPTDEWTVSFNAFVKSWGMGEAETDGKYTWEGSVRVDGEPVIAIGASTGLTTPFFTVSGAGTLIVPAAAGDVYEYVVNIGTAIASVTITPTAAAGVITITANGVSQVVVSGNPSTAITLGAAGSITEATIEVQETGKVAKTYTLQLTRAAA